MDDTEIKLDIYFSLNNIKRSITLLIVQVDALIHALESRGYVTDDEVSKFAETLQQLNPYKDLLTNFDANLKNLDRQKKEYEEQKNSDDIFGDLFRTINKEKEVNENG